MTESERHAQIQALVRRIRSETGRAVPDVDPAGPGITALVLVVLRDPGRLGALTTNYLSLTNPDETTLNQISLFAEAGLPTDRCTWWNAVPWDLEGRAPKKADYMRGAGYLLDLIALMDRSPVVVACGNVAHDVCDQAGLTAIKVAHPSWRGLRGGGADRRPAFVAGLREAARQAGLTAP